QYCPFANRSLKCIFEMEARVLPRPTEFDQILLGQSQTESQPVARIRIEDEPSMRPFNCRLDSRAHAGPIANQRGEVEAQWFRRCWLTGPVLGGKSARNREKNDQDCKSLQAAHIVSLSWEHKESGGGEKAESPGTMLDSFRPVCSILDIVCNAHS